MENISNFLEQASHLGVISSDLFQTADLHDLRNPAQVITTILALARAVGCYSPTKRLLSPSSTENIQPITLNYESPASSSSKPHIFITNSDTPVAIISTPVPPPPSPTPLLVSSTPVSPLPKRREHRNETKKCLLPKSNSSPSKLIELSPSSASAAAVGTKERITVFEQSESGDDQQMVANYVSSEKGEGIGRFHPNARPHLLL